MDVAEAIRTRRSIGRLGGDVPEATVCELIELATYAPNHRLTEPWCFTVLTGAMRERLGRFWGERAADAQGLVGDARAASIGADITKLERGPVLIVVSTRTDDDPVVAEEDFAATAAAVQNILLAAHARGLGAMWRTGRIVRDPEVKRFLGLDPTDRIVATVFLGEPALAAAPPRTRGLRLVWLNADEPERSSS